MARKKRVSSSAVLVLKFIAYGGNSPTALGVIGLVFKSGAVVIVNVVELKVFLAKRRLPGVLVNGINMLTYGSRGQQRTAALSLKLAEVALMERYTGERPVLLLDDVMSELDPRRQRFLQDVVQEHEQVLLTATELSFFSPEFLAQASLYRVEAGAIRAVAADTAA